MKSTSAAEKAVIRAALRLARRNRDPEAWAEAETALAGRARDLAALAGAQPGGESRDVTGQGPPAAIAGFLPTASEPPVTLLLHALVGLSHPVLVPAVTHGPPPDEELTWIHLDPDLEVAMHPTLRVPHPSGRSAGGGAQGLRTAGCRLILMPALAVTAEGVRLGQGGGYYDRALAGFSQHDRPTTVAVIWDDEVLDELPHEPHDAPVDWILTPTRLFAAPGKA